MLHEVQHIIQHIEGFAPGGNIDAMHEIARRQHYQSMEFALARMSALKADFPLTHAAWQATQDDFYQQLSRHGISGFDGNGQRRAVPELVRELKSKPVAEWERARRYQLMADYNRVMEMELGKFGTKEYDRWMNAVSALTSVQCSVPEAGKDLYFRLAGEVEARNVQARLAMTSEQRRLTLPSETADIPEENQFISE